MLSSFSSSELIPLSVSDGGAEAALNRAALEQRLLALEEEAIQNNLLLEAFIRRLDGRFKIADPEAIARIRELSHDEANKIAAQILDSPAPPMPAFIQDTMEKDYNTFGDLIDETISKLYTRFC